jgi:ADP-ribose pyrophosphatase YjhB (NUDIX family)
MKQNTAMSTASTWIYHPHPDEHGQPFKILKPSVPSKPASWFDPDAVALWTPDSPVPEELNGVALTPWTDHPTDEAAWASVAGQLEGLEEPPLDAQGRNPAAGAVIVEPDGRVWIVRPSNGFAGYLATFPKGHADLGPSLQAVAIREAFEESGLRIEILGLIGDVLRTRTMTRYYLARRVGGSPAAMGWESQAVALVPGRQVASYVNQEKDRLVAAMAGLGGATP